MVLLLYLHLSASIGFGSLIFPIWTHIQIVPNTRTIIYEHNIFYAAKHV